MGGTIQRGRSNDVARLVVLVALASVARVSTAGEPRTDGTQPDPRVAACVAGTLEVELDAEPNIVCATFDQLAPKPPAPPGGASVDAFQIIGGVVGGPPATYVLTKDGAKLQTGGPRECTFDVAGMPGWAAEAPWNYVSVVGIDDLSPPSTEADCSIFVATLDKVRAALRPVPQAFDGARAAKPAASRPPPADAPPRQARSAARDQGADFQRRAHQIKQDRALARMTAGDAKDLAHRPGRVGGVVLCVDERGVPAFVQVRRLPGVAGEAAALDDVNRRDQAIVEGWRFRPLVRRGQAVPFCTTVSL